MNISILVTYRELNYSTLISTLRYFPIQITRLRHIRDTSYNTFMRKKDYVPVKLNPFLNCICTLSVAEENDSGNGEKVSFEVFRE